MEDENTTEANPVTAVEEGASHKKTGIGAEAVAVDTTVILHIAVGHTECVATRKNNSGH